MNRIEKIDQNFKIDTTINKEDIQFYSVLCAPFKVYGIFKDEEKFRRIPSEIAETVSEGVAALHACTAGGRVRFKTNSPYVAIHAKMENVLKMSHFALTGVAGFDMYMNEEHETTRFAATFRPPYDVTDGFESLIELCSGHLEMGRDSTKEITIHFPLYSDVKELYIGLSGSARLESADDYRNVNPIVYYGSSITQGGCASRPGMTYQNIITRKFHVDHINLGFSGSALAEDEMADYIKGLPMSVFVYDYDHNAPTVEHLAKTHEKMFKTIREANPDLPVVFLSRPKLYLTKEDEERLEVIKTTYHNALADGDENVYFISGQDLMTLCGDDGTIDGSHPTDFGFVSIATVLGDAMEQWGLI